MPDTNSAAAAVPADGLPVRTPKKAAIAAWVGSALEYYDFVIYGTAAALVFPKIFFPSGNAAAATVASLATFGVGYVARPIGSFLMGHLGDKLGRKPVLIGTLLLMGVSTFLVGCLPTYDAIGILAPILLVVLRLLQGLSAAGEQAGANSMSFEHSPDNRRGFFTSWTLSGTQGGQVLAPAIFLPLAALLSEEQLLTWGWRIPFLLSAIVVGVGYIIRRRLEETPVFSEEVAHGEVPKTPLSILFKYHWRSVLRVMFAAFIAMINTLYTVFALTFATSATYGNGFSSTFMLWIAIVANLIAIAIIPFWAILVRQGRPQADLRHRRHRVGHPGGGVHGRDRLEERRPRLDGRPAPGRRGLQHDQRGVAVDVRGVLPDQCAALRHGDRYAVRVRSGRVHPDHRCRPRRHR